MTDRTAASGAAERAAGSSPRSRARAEPDAIPAPARPGLRHATLSAAQPTPVAHGTALLWPLENVALVHARGEVAVRGGDLLVLDPAQRVRLQGPEGWTARLLDLGDRGVATRIGGGADLLERPLDGTTELARLVKQLWLVSIDATAIDQGQDLLDTHFIPLLVELGSTLVARQAGPRSIGYANATVARARLLIVRHLADPEFGVASLAQAMRISTRHLFALFAPLAVTPSRAILDARMTLARRLLAEPANRDRQIADIARACGYADQGHFARRFRHETGLNPRQFKEEHRRSRTNRSRFQDSPELGT